MCKLLSLLFSPILAISAMSSLFSVHRRARVRIMQWQIANAWQPVNAKRRNVSRRFPQDNPRHLRLAEKPQRVLPCQAAAHVHHRRRSVKRAAIVLAAIAARHEHRAEHRQPNLAAMHMPRQHQVDVVLPRPARCCPAYGSGKAERFLPGNSTDPGAGANHGPSWPTTIIGSPRTSICCQRVAEHGHADAAQPAADQASRRARNRDCRGWRRRPSFQRSRPSTGTIQR